MPHKTQPSYEAVENIDRTYALSPATIVYLNLAETVPYAFYASQNI
jgi:hypothetical protein